ncbi:MAG TPA: hypothetical protein PLV68_19835, partial [Ilumatobacteraceae bacterium]|nr:hypothetical protein [Ilumatobacteraceae bacterium]
GWLNPIDGTKQVGFIICAVVFFAMGGLPLLGAIWVFVRNRLRGGSAATGESPANVISKNLGLGGTAGLGGASGAAAAAAAAAAAQR